jgi:hypothetical protein
LNLYSKAQIAEQIFNVQPENFVALAREIHQGQLLTNQVFSQYRQATGRANQLAVGLQDFTFLPISFFKTHEVKCFDQPPAIIFTSSGTTGMVPSRHFVKDLDWYERSFMASFSFAYGDPAQLAWLCLLPAYLERQGSSLVYMANAFVQASAYRESGFFLKADENLLQAIENLRKQKAPAVLLGVTFALLDFADVHAGLDLNDIIIMETGGMKGRRKEMVRAEVHEQLKAAFKVPAIHSEYGMTELMSQAYSKGNGIYQPPPWMKLLVRNEEEPFAVNEEGAGILCIIDLANIDSCAFIETEDVGRVHADGSFEVLGRIDNSDIRGCSLLVV